MSVSAYISIGSNIGDRFLNCQRAIDMLRTFVAVTAESSWYCTEPVGYLAQPEFVNAVLEISTDVTPQELLNHCRTIESMLGRERLIHWGPRTIDIDILMFGNVILATPDLEIPHPRMTERGFVLIPLCEIAPNLIHPQSQKSIARHVKELPGHCKVTRCAQA